MPSRFAFRLTEFFTAATLVLVGLEGFELEEAAVAVSGSTDQKRAVDSAPDRVSAMTTAVAQGSRVEDLSARTPTSSSYANSDGTWTVDSYSGAVRSESDSGSWEPIDLRLSRHGDAFESATVPYDASYSAGGDRMVGSARVAKDASLSIGWPTPLPEPVTSGAVLTYRDAARDADLVVTPRSDGFNYSMILDRIPDANGPPVEFKIPLKFHGVEPVAQQDGSILLMDGHKLRATITAPVMWDSNEANKDGSGALVPVAASVDSSNDGSWNVTLRPNMKFLLDPATTYPVTVDPSVILTAAGDTWVESAGAVGSQSASPELRVGSTSLGITKARTYLEFDLSAVPAGVTVTSASLGMTNFVTGGCTGGTVRLSRVTGSLSIPSITWAAQPATTASGSTTTTLSSGSSSCPGEATITWDATQVANEQLTAGTSALGLQIKADNEAASGSYRKYRSLENGDPAKSPKISLTYNTPPLAPDSGSITPSTTSGATYYTNTTKPTFATAITDPDGGLVTGELEIRQGASVVQSWTSSTVNSGAQASRTLTTALAPGTYTAQWRTNDGTSTSAWSPAVTFVVDLTPPPAPAMACTSYVNGTWYATRPAATTTCTVTAGASDVASVSVRDATADSNVTFPALSGGSSSRSFDIAVNDSVNWTIVSTDIAGNNSTSAGYSFGVGNGSFASPTPGTSTANTFTVQAYGSNIGTVTGATATTAIIQWRQPGSGTWTNATLLKRNGVAWSGAVTAVGGVVTTTGSVAWNAPLEPAIAGQPLPFALEIRACFNYSAGSQICNDPLPVSIVQHAFGRNFPTAEAGPATVSFLTGEFQLDSTDVVVPGYSDQLTWSRTYQSFGAATSAAQGVFGPGWVANLDGPSAGFGAGQVVDKTSSTSGTIMLVDVDGQTSTYKIGSPYSARKPGIYLPQGAAVAYNEKLEIPSTAPDTLVLTDADGVVTTWRYSTTTSWKVESVVDGGASLDTKYSYDSAGLLTGIYSSPPGVSSCSLTSQTRGCRALLFSYASFAGVQRVTGVELRIWDPTASGGAGAMISRPVAAYAYDSSGRLTSSWDPRLDYSGNHVSVNYSYQTVGGVTYLASMRPPNQDPWRFNLDSAGKLVSVARDNPTSVGGVATWAIDYNVPLSGSSALPTMTATSVNTWGQHVAPTRAAAIYGPDSPGTSDYSYGDISYFTNAGATVNEATFGAGEWLIDSYEYDQFGNQIWTLDASTRSKTLAQGYDASVIRDLYGSSITYNATGDRIEEIYGGGSPIDLKNGVHAAGAPHTEFVYDDEASLADMPGRPAGWSSLKPAPNLVIKEIHSVAEFGGAIHDSETTWYRYQPIVAGDGNGWNLRTPTRVSRQLGAGWSTSLSRFDVLGRPVESRTPQGVSSVDGTAADSRSTFMQYYTADASSADPACRNNLEWAGALCVVKPGAGSAATTRVTSYNYLLSPAVETVTSGSTVRTSTTTYDSSGRPVTESLATTNAPSGETAIPNTTYSYEPATGELLSTTRGAATAAQTYDSWGRVRTQSDGAGNTSTIAYDSAGRLRTLDDGKGTYTYDYDGTDAAGKTERRGLVTHLDVGLTASPDEFNASYDASGGVSKLVYPNGITAVSTYDTAGFESKRDYLSGAFPFMSFQQTADVAGRTRMSYTPLSTVQYQYDERERLARVEDSVAGICTTRVYQLSLDSNRNAVTSYAPTSTGSCSTSSGSSTVSSTFDADDRITTAGYSYDNLGRSIAVPAADLGNPTDGPIAVGYFADDMVASLTRPSAAGGAQAKTYTLDALGRVGTVESSTSGVTLRSSTNHYLDSTDTPAWTAEQTRPNASTSWTSSWTRFVESPTGDLALISKSDGTSRIQLSNLHGDIVWTMPNTSTPFAGASNYFETNEFGVARSETPRLDQNYAWLGQARRSQDALGDLVIMGARLYNPTTGRFLSRDAILGGNDNSYVYPPDPINQFDLDGLDTRCMCGVYRATGNAGAGGQWGYGGRPPGCFCGGTRSTTPAAPKPNSGVYVVKDVRNGRVFEYVGQSKNISRRLRAHVRNPKNGITKEAAENARRIEVKGNKFQREIREQREIDKRGGVKGGKLTNKVNPVGPKRQAAARAATGSASKPRTTPSNIR